ncbi:MAG: amidohydrolase family protein [Gemmatimonadetes bacterium]|nr:amidohydrolase family protein [Gemmatimonadota bacterium]
MSIALSLLAAVGLAAGPFAAPAAAQKPTQNTGPQANAPRWKAQTEVGVVPLPRGTLLIRDLDATWTATGQVLRNVSIVIQDGVIRAISAEAVAPAGATVIDGTGLTAIPGLVDEHSHIAMDRGTNEGTAPVVPEVRVIDALDPGDLWIYRALSGGVTTAQVLHGSANPIGGQSAIIKTRWGMDDPRKLLVQGAPQSVKFALGENVTRKNFQGPPGSQQRYPATRAGVEAIYVQAFSAAQAYQKAWDDYRANPKKYRVPPRRDLRLEALAEILEGRIRVHAHSYRSDEIVMLMRVAERFGFRIDAFTHVLEGYKVASELKAHGAGASTFSDWWMYKLEAYDAIPYNAAIMHEHGVLTSLNSDIPWLQSFMVYEINKPVKYGGVSKEDALRMLTLYPARQLRIEDKVGSLEPGKDADVVLLSGSPFDAYSRVEKTIVDGIVYYDRTRDAELRGRPVREMPKITPRPPTVTDGGGASPRPRTAASGAASGDSGMPQAGPIIALMGGTVHPVSAPEITGGAVVIRGGRIVAVGPASAVEIPGDASRIDVSGKHVYPGMIDALTQMGLVEIESWSAARDDREVGRFNPHIRGLAAVHPESDAIPVARANGITAVMSVPTSGIIRGAGSVVQLDGDTPERMAIRDRAALVIDFPSPSGKGWDEPKLEGDRLEELMALFERAALFAKRPTTNGDPTSRFEPQAEPEERILLEAMVPAMRGEMPVLFSARTERDIRTLLLFLDKFPDVKAVLVGGDQAFRVGEELAKRRIPVIVGSGLTPTMDEDDPVTAGWENAGVLHKAGVRVAFSTQNVADVRNLPYHAARSAAYGLPKDVALRAVTLTAAEILGLGEEMGSIDVGKRADLIVTDGDPLQIVTHVERAFIGGREVSLESRHTRLWKEFRGR